MFIRLQIFDRDNDRYEPPMPLNLPKAKYPSGSEVYKVKYSPENRNDFNMQIIRKSTNTKM